MGVDGWMDERRGEEEKKKLLIEEIRRQGKHENRWVPALMCGHQETARKTGETSRQRDGHEGDKDRRRKPKHSNQDKERGTNKDITFTYLAFSRCFHPKQLA